ncbi:unnamed protein product [Effrenium voratum]|nr:unnamed protein product [Effrenium voratum]
MEAASDDSSSEQSSGDEGVMSVQSHAPGSPSSNAQHTLGRRQASKPREGGEDRKQIGVLGKAWHWLQQQTYLTRKADQEAILRQKVNRKFRELDEDGEGLTLADVATLLTDVLGHTLDRDAMLRLAANVYDSLEKSEQELLQLADLQGSLETVTVEYEAMVKRQRQHSSKRGDAKGSWLWVQRLAGYVQPPDSPYLAVWDFVKRLVVVYYFLEVPMRFCIINFDFQDEDTTWMWILVNMGMDVFMFANVPLNFLRGYEEAGLVIRDFEQIRRRYLLGAFSWDLIAALPFDVLADPSFSRKRTYATWRLLKLIHLRHLFAKKHEKSSERREGGFAFTTVTVMLQLCFLLHFMACFYWYIGNGWPTQQQILEQHAGTGHMEVSWITAYYGMGSEIGMLNAPDVPVIHQYMLSIYGMMFALINDSSDLLVPASWNEVFWLIVSFVVSVALMGNLDGTLVGKVISQDESIVEQRVMRARIDTFIKNSGLPQELVEQIRISAGGGEEESQGEGGKIQRAADVRTIEVLLTNLSHSLLQRIGRRVFLKWLAQLPIFKDCTEPFLLQLATICRPLTVPAGSFVCRAGEPTRDP